MISKRGTRKKKHKDQLADDGIIYDSTLSGIGVQTTREEKDQATIQALEELVFGGKVSFKRSRDRKDSEDEEGSDDEVPSKYDTTGLQTESVWVDEDDEIIRYNCCKFNRQ